MSDGPNANRSVLPGDHNWLNRPERLNSNGLKFNITSATNCLDLKCLAHSRGFLCDTEDWFLQIVTHFSSASQLLRHVWIKLNNSFIKTWTRSLVSAEKQKEELDADGKGKIHS